MSLKRLILWGSIGFFGALLLFVGPPLWKLKKSRAEAELALEKHLAFLKVSDFDSAVANCSPLFFSQNTTREQVKLGFRQHLTSLGTPQSHTINGWFSARKSIAGQIGTMVTFQCSLSYQSGTASERFAFWKPDGLPEFQLASWAIIKINRNPNKTI